MTVMGDLTFQDAYHEKGDSSVVQGDDEQRVFDIDSDASDVNLWERNWVMVRRSS